jgi:hypothetical protein
MLGFHQQHLDIDGPQAADQQFRNAGSLFTRSFQQVQFSNASRSGRSALKMFRPALHA